MGNCELAHPRFSVLQKSPLWHQNTFQKRKKEKKKERGRQRWLIVFVCLGFFFDGDWIIYFIKKLGEFLPRPSYPVTISRQNCNIFKQITLFTENGGEILPCVQLMISPTDIEFLYWLQWLGIQGKAFFKSKKWSNSGDWGKMKSSKWNLSKINSAFL